MYVLNEIERYDYFVEFLKQLARTALEITEDNIDIKTDFNTLGFDSLMSISLRQLLIKKFNINIPAQTFIDDINIQKLANKMNRKFGVGTTINETTESLVLRGEI